MIDPELTKVLGRRILASVINLLAVIPLSLMIIALQAQRFAITERGPGGVPVFPRYSPEGLKLAELDETFNTAIDFGDTFYVWNTASVFLSILTVLLISLVIWVLVPASIGWSPGHRIMGLKVVTIDGEDPPLDGYLRRFVVGIIDLFPYVVPGLLGWLTASRSEHSQRIGDLSGDTVVIDANAEIRLIDADAYISRKNKMVDMQEAMPAATPMPRFSPDQVIAEAEAAQASRWTKPQAEPETVGLYIPTHIEVAEEVTSEVEPEAEVLVETDVQAEAEFQEETETEVAAAAADQTEDDEEEIEVEVENEILNTDQVSPWPEPVGEPAPVWEPAAESADTRTSEPDKIVQTALAGPSGDVAPTWSDDWQAWLFWDHVNQRWLRHVEEDDTWLPIS